MDYKFVEQLLEKYFAAETSREEERVLRDCMTLSELPEHLARYSDLFLYEDAQANEHLDEDFDKKVLAAAGIQQHETLTVHARRTSVIRSLRPLWQAAAVVAIVALIGIGAGRSFSQIDDDTQMGSSVVAEQQQSIAPDVVKTASVDTIPNEH